MFLSFYYFGYDKLVEGSTEFVFYLDLSEISKVNYVVYVWIVTKLSSIQYWR